MNRTLVVNLIAPPGSGKSTMAADIFAKLKYNKIDCELVTEFAKELVWEERNETFKNEVYIFAKQFHRLFRLKDKVDVIVTDRPLILSAYYNNKYGGDNFNGLNPLVLEQHHKFKNINFYIDRVKEYNPNGRNETEEESNQMGIEIKEMLDYYNIKYHVIKGLEETAGEITKNIIEEHIRGGGRN